MLKKITFVITMLGVGTLLQAQSTAYAQENGIDVEPTEEELSKITQESVFAEALKDFTFTPSRELLNIARKKIENYRICANASDPYLRDYSACYGAINLSDEKALETNLNAALQHTKNKDALRRLQQEWSKDFEFYNDLWTYVGGREVYFFGIHSDRRIWFESRSKLLWDLSQLSPETVPVFIEKIPEEQLALPPFSTDLSHSETFQYLQNIDLTSETPEDINSRLDEMDICQQSDNDLCLRVHDAAWMKIIEDSNTNSIQRELDDSDVRIDRTLALKLLQEDHLQWLRDMEKHCATGFFYGHDASEYYRCRINKTWSRYDAIEHTTDRLQYIMNYPKETATK